MKINAASTEGLPSSGETRPVAQISQTTRILKRFQDKKMYSPPRENEVKILQGKTEPEKRRLKYEST